LRRRLFLYQQKHQARLAYNGGVPDDIGAPTGDPLYLDQPDQPIPAERPDNALADTAQSVIYDQPADSGVAGVAAPTSATTFNTRRTAPSTIVASTVRLALKSTEFPPPPSVPNRARHFECPYCCLLVEERKRAPNTGRHMSYTTCSLLFVSSQLVPTHTSFWSLGMTGLSTTDGLMLWNGGAKGTKQTIPRSDSRRRGITRTTS